MIFTPDIMSFWKPEELSNMEEVEQGLKDLRVWQGSKLNRKINIDQLKEMHQAKRSMWYNKQIGAYVEACIASDMVTFPFI